MPAEPVLVTGAEGFVGGLLLPYLRAAFPEREILGTSRVPAGALLALDVTDRAAMRACIARVRPSICIHLAGISAIAAARADPDLAWAVNLHGTLGLADAILAEAPACRLVFASTAEVYGASFASGRPLDEQAPLAPQNLYAAAKAAADLALGALAGEGLRAIRLRLFNHTGPGQAETFVVPAFAGQIARIEAGRAPPVLRTGALEPKRDFLDARDVCAAYAAVVARDAALPANFALNIASGAPVRIGVILEKLLALARVDITVARDPARLRRAEIAVAAGDAGLARRLLGWAPNIALEDTLQAVLEAARRREAKLLIRD